MGTRRMFRSLGLAFALFALGSSAAAAPLSRADIRKLNDDNVRLRDAASVTGAVLGSYDKGEAFEVLEAGARTERIDGKSGTWLKVRNIDGAQGFVFSSFLDRAAAGFFKAKDFPSDDLYGRYLHLSLRRGERVLAIDDYEKVKSGALGWYSSYSDGEPPFLVVWDEDLDATPSDEAIVAALPRILEDRIYFVNANILEIAGSPELADFSELALGWTLEREAEFAVGATVSLGRHLQVSAYADSDNWSESMAEYVGKDAIITERAGEDSDGRPVARIDLDDGNFVWRIENMRLQAAAIEAAAMESASSNEEIEATDAEAIEHYGMIKAGSLVILGRHDEVDGSSNWNDEMGAFVGRATRVTELAGTDDSGCLGVRVEGNAFFWRVRNLAMKGRGEAGGYGFVVGDRIILGRHREINGESNWADEMEEYLGLEATITDLVGVERGDAACYLATVDIDGGQWSWRVENMEPVE